VDVGQTQQSVITHWNGTDAVVTMPDICVSAPTAARVASFSAHPQKSGILFRWRMSSTTGVAGFSLFAGHAQLNRQVIRPHASPRYRYHATWTGGGKYTLHVLLNDGQEITVPGQS
jgi:hypothetical protein